MLKKTLFTAVLLIHFFGFSQEQTTDTLQIIESEIIVLKGQIVNFEGKIPLEGAHIFNMNSVRGTIANSDGTFSIPTQANDTLFISHIGFQSIKLKVINDLLKGNVLEIALFEKVEQIAEVNVRSTTLIGVLEIDAKNIPMDKFTRIHINGLPQTYEIGKPTRRNYGSPVAALFNPIDFVYSHFGKNPKELKKLKKMKEENEIRDMLETKIDREIMLEYLDLTIAELDELLNECNYSEYFIRTASDIQVIEAVLECYENYKAVKKGTTKRE